MARTTDERTPATILRVLGTAAFSLAACITMAVVACDVELERPDDGPLTFDVGVVNGDIGTPTERVPYQEGERVYTIDIRAIDQNGDLARDFDGEVHLAVGPNGYLAEGQPETVALKDGMAEGVSVALEKVHGDVGIWVEYIGNPSDLGNYATGLSDTIHVAHPTIREMQETDKHRLSPLRGQYIQANLDGRIAVVTGVTNDGYYVTDLSEPDGQFAGMFVFTHSRPEGIERGMTITALNGNVDEFFGFTEMGFPAWKVGPDAALPPPIELTPQMLADSDGTEAYESQLVEIRDVIVCQPGDDFRQFGQWVVTFAGGSCSNGDDAISVLSTFTIPDFDPNDHVGESLPRITGNLREHSSSLTGWILYPRGPEDMESSTG